MKRTLLAWIVLLTLASAAVVATLVLITDRKLTTPPAAERSLYGSIPSDQLPELWAAPEFDFQGVPQNTSNASLRGHVWIGSFIFTTCTAVCPAITASTVLLQRQLVDPSLRFISFSVDPEHDTLPVLAEYAKRWNPDEPRWLLLRPEASDLSRLADGMRVALEPTDDPKNPILHTTFLFLVDARGQVRGVYDSFDEAALARLVSAVHQLQGAAPAAASETEETGEAIAMRLGCHACHSRPEIAPALDGIAGTVRRLEGGKSVTADRAYFERALLEPGVEVVDGFLRLMPSYRAHLSPLQLNALLDYLMALTPAPATAPTPPEAVGTAGDAEQQPNGVRAESPRGVPPTARPPTTPAADALPTTSASAAAPEPPARIEIDPVCDMRVRVLPQTPAATHAGQTRHFCSEGCRKRFEKNPAKYSNAH